MSKLKYTVMISELTSAKETYVFMITRTGARNGSILPVSIADRWGDRDWELNRGIENFLNTFGDQIGKTFIHDCVYFPLSKYVYIDFEILPEVLVSYWDSEGSIIDSIYSSKCLNEILKSLEKEIVNSIEVDLNNFQIKPSAVQCEELLDLKNMNFN
jgi:hypothetical protein